MCVSYLLQMEVGPFEPFLNDTLSHVLFYLIPLYFLHLCFLLCSPSFVHVSSSNGIENMYLFLNRPCSEAWCTHVFILNF